MPHMRLHYMYFPSLKLQKLCTSVISPSVHPLCSPLSRTTSMSGRIEEQVKIGTVRLFCRSKGHGFIDPEEVRGGLRNAKGHSGTNFSSEFGFKIFNIDQVAKSTFKRLIHFIFFFFNLPFFLFQFKKCRIRSGP